MNIQVDSILKNSFVITISDKRYDVFCERFNRCSLNSPLPKKYIGFQIPNGLYNECGFFKTRNLCNCFFSHMAIVKAVQALGLDYVCIFEDDAYPCKGCKEKLQSILDALPDDVDLLKLGHLGSLNTPTSIDNNFEYAKTYGSHAYIVFKKYYDRYIEMSKKDLHIDRSSMNKNQEYKVYSTKKILFMQRDDGFSDVLHDNKMYYDLLKKQGQLDNFDLA